MYGSEVQSWTSKTASNLQAAETRILRLIKVVTRRDGIRNVQIREVLNVVPLLDDIDRKMLRWYGHVKRMSEGKSQNKQFLE